MKLIATRRVDDLGRIVLPLDLRQEMDIHRGVPLDICVNNDGNIVLRSSKLHCLFCKSSENIVSVMGKPICLDCIKKLKETGSEYSESS